MRIILFAIENLCQPALVVNPSPRGTVGAVPSFAASEVAKVAPTRREPLIHARSAARGWKTICALARVARCVVRPPMPQQARTADDGSHRLVNGHAAEVISGKGIISRITEMSSGTDRPDEIVRIAPRGLQIRPGDDGAHAAVDEAWVRAAAASYV